MSTVASHDISWQTDASDTAGARHPRRREEAFPAGMVLSLDTHEFDELNQLAAGWSVQHHPLGARACRSTLFMVKTASLQVAHVQHAVGYSSQGESPAGMLSFAAPLDEARPMVHRGHGIGPMELGVTRSGEEYECVCRSGVRFVVASVVQGRSAQYAADLWNEPGLCRHPSDRLRFVDSASRSRYLDACGRILGAVAEQPGLLGDQRAAALLEERFLEGLFLNAHGAPPGASDRSRYALARQAYRYLQDHVDDVPTVRELCAASGGSYATLERAFRETYGMTPKTMMGAMRLSGARRTLLHPSPTVTVTAVAVRWGFVELGRFSVQYRQRYGEVPSETLRRARGESPRIIACPPTPRASSVRS